MAPSFVRHRAFHPLPDEAPEPTFTRRTVTVPEKREILRELRAPQRDRGGTAPTRRDSPLSHATVLVTRLDVALACGLNKSRMIVGRTRASSI
jgi:hypothetical protein